MKLKLSLIILFMLLYSCEQKQDLEKKYENEIIKNDSVNLYLKKAKNKVAFKDKERIIFLNLAYHKIKDANNDSIALKHLSTIAYEYLELHDTTSFIKKTHEALSIGLKHKDSFAIGDAHWNYASYYNNMNYHDSAYYHFNTAQSFFKNKPYYIGRMLIGKAYIKGVYADFSGAESLDIDALKIFKALEENQLTSNVYNHIGYVQKMLGNYEKALFYYKKAIEFDSYSNNKGGKKLNLENNIALVYQKMGRYNESIKYFNKRLTKDLKTSNIENYARLLDNIHYTRLLNKDTINVFNKLLESLSIRDSLNDKKGVLVSKKHLGEYYLYAKDTLKSYTYISEANNLANKIKDSDDVLATLMLLAKIDRKNATQYLQKHIKYKDSLQKIQLEFQNKFARISYETEEYIEETQFLKRRQRFLIILALGMITIISLLYILKRQHVKTQKLEFETEQQKLNEELYVLALKRQEKLEEAKTKERNRISEELHDGVLSRLFGTRVGFDFLEITSNQETKAKYEQLINELQSIEKEIRNLSHQLSDSSESSTVGYGLLIEELLKRKSVLGNFDYIFNNDEALLWDEVSPIIKVNLYRIIQEALQNIIKYANASLVTVTSELCDNHIKVSIKDNGKGFDISKHKKGIGLKNMKSRINKLHGEYVLTSAIAKGTKIILSVPL